MSMCACISTQQMFIVVKYSPRILLIIRASESQSVLSDSLRPLGLYSPWNSPGQNTGVGNRSREAEPPANY